MQNIILPTIGLEWLLISRKCLIHRVFEQQLRIFFVWNIEEFVLI